MYRIMLTAMLLAPPALLPAQVEAAGEKGSAAEATYQQLSAEFTKAQRAFRIASVDARRKGVEVEMEQPGVAVLPGFQEAAKEYAGTEDAVQFLTWIALNAGEAKATGSALDTLAGEHIASEGWASLAPRLLDLVPTVGEDRIAGIIGKLLEGHPDDAVKGGVLFARGNQVIQAAYEAPAPEDARVAAIADLRQASKLLRNTETALSAEKGLFELENLQNGMPAPEIIGEDLDGVEFKLSDYLGKVVVLDFWGDW